MLPQNFPFLLVQDMVFPAQVTLREQALGSATINAAGNNYAVNDTITLTGGTFSQPVLLEVLGLSGSGVSSIAILNNGAYSGLPTNPVAQGSTSGIGTGATFNLTFNPTYLYSWIEQTYAVDGTFAVAYPSPRTGSAQVQAALELNNSAVTINADTVGAPLYVWLRRAHAYGAYDQRFEFIESVGPQNELHLYDAHGFADTQTASITFVGTGSASVTASGSGHNDTVTINVPSGNSSITTTDNASTDANTSTITFGSGLTYTKGTGGSLHNDTITATGGGSDSVQINTTTPVYPFNRLNLVAGAGITLNIASDTPAAGVNRGDVTISAAGAGGGTITGTYVFVTGVTCDSLGLHVTSSSFTYNDGLLTAVNN